MISQRTVLPYVFFKTSPTITNITVGILKHYNKPS